MKNYFDDALSTVSEAGYSIKIDDVDSNYYPPMTYVKSEELAFGYA